MEGNPDHESMRDLTCNARAVRDAPPPTHLFHLFTYQTDQPGHRIRRTGWRAPYKRFGCCLSNTFFTLSPAGLTNPEPFIRFAVTDLSTPRCQGNVQAKRFNVMVPRLTVAMSSLIVASLAWASGEIADTVHLRVTAGDTLIELLDEAGSHSGDAARAIDALMHVFDPRDLQAGDTVTVGSRRGDDGAAQLLEIILTLDGGFHVVTSRLEDGSYSATRMDGPLDETLTVPVPDSPPRVTADGLFGRHLEVRRGDTLTRLAGRAGASRSDADAAIRAISQLLDPRSLQVGQQLQFAFSDGDTGALLRAVGIVLAENRHVIALRQDNESWVARYDDKSFLSQEQEVVPDVSHGDLSEVLEELESGALRHVAASVAAGDTFTGLLVNHGTTINEAIESARAIGNHYDPRRLRVGQRLHLVFFPGPAGSSLEVLGIAVLDADAEGLIIAMRNPGGGGFSGQRAFSIETVLNAIRERIPAEAEEPAVAMIEVTGDVTSSNIVIEPGDTLMSALRAAGPRREEADQAIRALTRHFNPRRLQPGQHVRVILDSSGGKTRLVAVSVSLGDDRYAQASLSGDGYVSEITATPYRPAFAPTPDPDGVDAADDPGSFDRPKRLGRGIIVKRQAAADAQVAETSDDADTENAAADEPPAQTQIAAPETPGISRKAFVVEEGEILMAELLEIATDTRQAHAATFALGEVFNLRRIRAGQHVDAVFDDDGLLELAMTPVPGERIVVRRGDDDTYTAEQTELPLELQYVAAGGKIVSSLYQAAVDEDVPVGVLQRMILSYSFDIDFQREIQRGDSFSILYERFVDEAGDVVRYGLPLFMSLNVSGAPLPVYRFTPQSGFADYFNDVGESVRKALLRTPVDGARITSGFGQRTLFGYTAMHKGVDFGVPTGTPVMAAGNGVIEALGYNGGYGNYIRIRHNGTYKTAYAHMSRYAEGLAAGSRVRQGQTIGFVGSTGRSTGPHLHYEVLVNNVQINPLDVRLPAGEILAGDELERFYSRRDQLDELFSEHLVRQVSWQ